MFNAESKDSPLRNFHSHIYNTDPSQDRGRRYFPDKKYGNNRESPSFFQLPNIYNNSVAHKNIFAISNSGLNGLNKKTTVPFMQKELIKFASKPNYIIKKNLDVSQVLNTQSNQNGEKEISLPNIYSNTPAFKSAYLKNVNEYNIIENGKMNMNRVVSFRKKPQGDYNCIINKNIQYLPTASIDLEKWPMFYENYYSLATKNEKAFAIKDGLFTRLVNNKLMGVDQQNRSLRKNRHAGSRNIQQFAHFSSPKTLPA